MGSDVRNERERGKCEPGAVQAACQELADAGLIHWNPLTGSQEGVFIGTARITGLGVDVVNGSRATPIDVHIQKSADHGGSPHIQADAKTLFEAIALATAGFAGPVVLEDLPLLPMMSADRSKAAFRYLKSKGLIEANFSVFYAARLSAAGHDVVATTAVVPTVNKAVEKADVEMFTLKPTLWGMSVDLKEMWRWLCHRLKKT